MVMNDVKGLTDMIQAHRRYGLTVTTSTLQPHATKNGVEFASYELQVEVAVSTGVAAKLSLGYYLIAQGTSLANF